MKDRRKVISFDLSAIDLILVLSVVLLLVLYLTKLSGSPQKKSFKKVLPKPANIEKKLPVSSQNQHTKCPRGFGDIKKFNQDNSISERCLGCYMIMECYTEGNTYSENVIT